MKDYEHTRPASSPIIRLFGRNSRAAKPELSKADVANRLSRQSIPEEFEQIDGLPDYDDGEDFTFDALAELEATNGGIGVALVRMKALASEIAAIKGLLAQAFGRAGVNSEWWASADYIALLTDDDMQKIATHDQLRTALWQFSQAVNPLALDHAITAVQLAEFHSDFRE